ncbi:MAG: hypothetical protein ABFR05_02415 [Bacteroidota bacterium]
MKKIFRGVNKFFKKYQPTIQAVGIIAIMIALLVDISQNRLIQGQMDIDKEERLKKLIPLFQVDLEINKSNSFIDKMVFSNINYKHILQNVNIYTLNGIQLVDFKIHNKNFSTTKLKNILIDISRDYYSQYTTGLLNFKVNNNSTEVLSYPLIIDFTYFENNELKRKSFLYEYQFRIFFLDDVRKIKSEGIIMNSILYDTPDNYKNRLLDYSISHSKPLGSIMYQDDIKYKLMKKDTIYSLIINLIQLDLESRKTFLKYKYCDCDTLKSSSIYYYTPNIYFDENLFHKRDSIISKIFNRKPNLNKNILKKIILIQDSINMFTRRNFTTDKSKMPKDSFEVFENKFDIWVKMHQNLLNVAIDEYKF